MDLIFESESVILSSKVSVYKDRIDFTLGWETKSILINKITSVTLPLWCVPRVILLTSSGEKIEIPTFKKKDLRNAIYKAQEEQRNNSNLRDN